MELYGIQQQLSKLHQNLEKSLENYQNAAVTREQSELKLSHLSQNHKLKAEELELLKSKCISPFFLLHYFSIRNTTVFHRN